MDLENDVEWVARLAAEAAYRREHPGCAQAEARAWAEGHWRDYLGQAAEVLALRALWRGARQAAPWN